MEASVHDKNEVSLGKHPPAPSMLLTEALMFMSLKAEAG